MAKAKRDNSPSTVSEIDAAMERARLPKVEAIATAARKDEHRAGDCPPLGNTGGKGTDRTIELVLDDGKLVEIPARRGWGDESAFVDWVNFTCHEETFIDPENFSNYDSRRIIATCSMVCERIFGYGITETRKTGANFYERSYVLGDGFGMVCHGGQQCTLLISVSGTGCAAAKPGWEKRLHDWLQSEAKQSRITRADLAHDDFEGLLYSVDQMARDYDDGLFQTGGRGPDCEMRGNWKKPNGKGRTFYVGHAANGKLARGYEKGKQLGCSKSPWVRVEGQLGSRDRIIPFDVLLKPGAYLAAMYPAFGWISKEQERIQTARNTAMHSVERQIEITSHQSGGAIWALLDIFDGDHKRLVETLMRPGKLPRRLIVPDYRDSPEPFHVRPIVEHSEAAFTHLAMH